MSDPFYSIIIPTYNCGGKLAQSLDSVFSQEGTSFEVIIHDGASSDNTLSVIEDYASRFPMNVRWVSEKDRGVYFAMNAAIDKARGKYLYFLGAGDTIRPGMLVRVAEKAPGDRMALVYGRAHILTDNYIDGREQPITKVQLLFSGPCHQAVFYARGIFDLVGKYDTKYRLAADWALNIKCFGNPKVEKIFVPWIIADYEGGGMSFYGGIEPAFAADIKRLGRTHLGALAVFLYQVAPKLRSMENRVAGRIERAQGALARKFWHAQLWLLHKTARPLVCKLAGGDPLAPALTYLDKPSSQSAEADKERVDLP